MEGLLRTALIGFTFGLAVAGMRGELPEFLQRFDTNNDHQIDEEERQAIRDLRSNLRQKKRQSIDRNDDGLISIEEVKSAREFIRQKISARRQEKFRAISGEDEAISPSEYASIPGLDSLPKTSFERLWNHLDLNKDGMVTFGEFEGTLRTHTPPDPEGD